MAVQHYKTRMALNSKNEVNTVSMPKMTVRDHSIIQLGKQGENEVLQVIWRGIVPEWEEKYGAGEFQLAVRRNQDTAPYIANIELDGGDIVWTITSAETARVGDGECELTYTVGDSIAKSQIWTITVCESLTGQEPVDPPEPAKNWVDVVLKSSSDAKQSAIESAESSANAQKYAENAANSANDAYKSREAIENMEVSAVSLSPDSDATVEKAIVDDKIKLTFGIPKGKGEIEQFIVTMTDSKSDKTPAEIAVAAKTGKQVVLQRTFEGKIETGYLVSVTDKVAAFCFIGSLTSADIVPFDQMLMQEWATITADKAVKVHSEIHVPSLIIEKDANNNYSSTLSPLASFEAATLGSAANVFLKNEDTVLCGTIVLDNSSDFHIYFPDYAKGKVHDFKWNGDGGDDGDPSTYTFNEMSLGGNEGPMIINFTLADPENLYATADKTYEEIDAAYKQKKLIYGIFVNGETAVWLSNCTPSEMGYVFSTFDLSTHSLIFVIYTENSLGLIRFSAVLSTQFSQSPFDGYFDANDMVISNLGDPEQASDAATKGYVDKSLGASDLSLGITGTTVGQFLKVAEVDTQGKPTKWATDSIANAKGVNF